MKKKWTDDEIKNVYANAFRICSDEAEDAVESIKECITSGGTNIEKWKGILYSWGWDFQMPDKEAYKKVGRLMRAFGIKSKLKYTCAECGCKVEVKV